MNKRIPFVIFFAVLLLLSSTRCAPALDNQYQDIVANSLHELESSQSLNEAAPFQCILFSPDDFVLCRFVNHIGQRTQWGKANGGVS